MSGYAIVEQHAERADLGEVIRDGDRVGLRFVRHYDHPVARVWRAITESEDVRQWMPCDLVGERREGAAISLPFGAAEVEKYGITEPVLTGRIEAWQPESVFQWTWGGDVLRFELSSHAGGTQMIFTTWPESQDLGATADTAGGYHLCLAELGVLLDGHEVPAVVDIDTIARRFEQSYRERLGLPT